MKTKSLKIEAIRIDGDTQPRVELDQDLVAEYADLYEAKVELPPLEVVFDGSDHWLVDGFHRRWGAAKAGVTSLKCNITLGSLDEARWRSYAANQTHGKRRTNEDKRKAVLAALRHPSGAGLSDSQIAEHLGINHTTVSKYRKELESTCEIASQTERTGRDGRTISTANIGKTNGKPKDETPPEPENAEPEVDDEAETTEPTEEPATPATNEVFDTSQYDGWLKKLGEFANWCKAEYETQRGVLLAESKANIRGDIENLQQALRFSKPYATCPDCDGQLDTNLVTQCTTCKGRGWVSKEIYSQLPREVKSRAVVA